MIGRFSSVLAELRSLGVVMRPGPTVTLPVTPEQDAGVAALPLPSVSVLTPEPAPSDEVVIPVDEEVEAKIRALSGFPTEVVSAEPEIDSTDEDDEDLRMPDDSSEEEELAEALPEPAPLPTARAPRASMASRRLKEAFARLELLEACAADLRDALTAVAATIQDQEDT